MENNSIEQNDSDQLKPDLSKPGKSVYEQIRDVSEYILQKEGKTSESNTLPGPIIFERVKEEFEQVEFNRDTFQQYLSKANRDQKSSISTQGRRKGFYVSTLVLDEVETEEEAEAEENEVETTQRRKRVEREKRLYPVLVDWVQQLGYRTRDTSANKSSGKWNNPDVTGILATDTFNRTELEVLTVEAKHSTALWGQWIFEAVSHRRFANRSYFAFPATQELVPKLPPEMRHYADLYGIGILAVIVGEETHRSLIEEDEQQVIGLDEADVVEVYSAPFHYVQPRRQMDYCRSIGITTVQDLYTWGEYLQTDS